MIVVARSPDIWSNPYNAIYVHLDWSVFLRRGVIDVLLYLPWLLPLNDLTQSLSMLTHGIVSHDPVLRDQYVVARWAKQKPYMCPPNRDNFFGFALIRDLRRHHALQSMAVLVLIRT